LNAYLLSSPNITLLDGPDECLHPWSHWDLAIAGSQHDVTEIWLYILPDMLWSRQDLELPYPCRLIALLL